LEVREQQEESPDEQAVRALYREMLRSWNRRDARGFAALCSEAARVIGVDGVELTGRCAIELELARSFEHQPTLACIGVVRSIQRVGESVLLLSAIAGMYRPGSYRVDPAWNAVQTLIVAREHGRFRVISLQSTLASFDPHSELAQRVTAELELALVRVSAATTRS
jgi:uncharacterized protein (TIGR02246 family)